MDMFIALLLMTMLPSMVSAAETQSPQVQEVILENGLKVLLLENHKSPVVTFQVWYRVGSRNEVDGKSGLAHFLEHMMFKGTRKVAPEEYSRIIARNGGRSNAFTTTDVTVYFATMSRDKIAIQIEMEADRMVNALLEGNTFEAEKKVVMEERRLRTEDNPASALGEVTAAAAYLIHPYRRPVIGWMSDIEGLTPHDLRKYYRTYYSPNNAVIVVVGDFSAPDIMAKIRASFGKIPRGPEPPKVTLEERLQSGERRVTLKKEAELPFLLVYYHAPTIKHPDSYALDVLTTILSAGRSSRLHQDMVYRKRIAASVSADYDALSIDPTVVSFSAQVMPDKDVGEVRRSLYAHIDRVRTEPVSDKELEKARNQTQAAFVFGQDSVFGQAMRLGRFEAAGDWKLVNSYLAGIGKVTATDILRVAKKYLNPDRRTVGVLIPTKEKAL
jgi:zinc protease